jgi:hypothetical protein
LRVEARAQPGRSFDLVSGAAKQPDRPFLLGESIGKDRRSLDSRLDLCAVFGRQRSVRERRELFLTTSSHPHKDLHGTSVIPERTPRAALYSRGIDARLRGL